MDWNEVIIRDARPLCADVMSIELEYDERLPAFDPGSHIDVRVEIADRQEVRSYSVVERLSDTSLRVAVRRLENGRGGSRYMHTLASGHRLMATLPSNHFSLGFEAPFVLLLAGGIGITPLIGMARALRRHHVPFRFVYLGRSRSGMPFLDDLASEFRDDFLASIDEETGVADLSNLVADLPLNAEVYMCGPGPMMEGVRSIWASAGRPAERLRFETFGNMGGAPAQPFRVVLPQHGLDLIVPADRTLLDILDEAGADPIFNCRRGECGLCAVDVVSLDGTIDHRDVFFSERERQEAKHFCSCVSRVTGTVTIEIP
ncbi:MULTISPECIES: PDR/VanB family oxidoreductase [unclassified Sphingobium]|uniref:PDR/VanB family oxidoreductase n=2 Tax=Sphingobium TaxID=165695 RepID=UPI000D17BD0E|nr:MULTISPECIES: PDR/VanB family oxidoreductase [unclassified Sphingobium]PSO09631.1 oxidoreductase [Sphingobium sp. AEW4]TWC97414.1 vanillate demethylase subunit B [Sphingobium sp. AEW010]TWD17774.1 vanillate demethylase subunit B [Sphingobium sp. AEW013]TWD20030.1 vanillate demethylase subunit B [Sphingobium sp. AEW001]